MPTESSAHTESPSMDAELNLTDSETESDEEASKINTRNQEEVQARPNPRVQDEGQAGPNPVLIHQDTSSVPSMTTPVIDLTSMQSDSPLPTSTTTTSIIITTITLQPPPPPQSTTDPILVHRIGELEKYITDLVQNNLALEERLEKHGSRLYKLENLNIPHQVSKAVDEIVADAMLEVHSYKAHTVHNDLYEALQKSLELDYSNQHLDDQEEARKKRQKRRDVPRTPPGSLPSQPPPPPPPAGAFGALGTLGASGSSQLPPHPHPPSTGRSGSAQQQGNKASSSSKKAASTSQFMAWTTSDTRYESAGVFGTHKLSPNDSLMQDDSILEEQVVLSDDEDSENDHQPKAGVRKDWWKPLPEEERPSTPEPAWTILFSNKSNVANN
ncbi:hypothetical protein Tco_1214957 [Tanacetum coccineum]